MQPGREQGDIGLELARRRKAPTFVDRLGQAVEKKHAAAPRGDFLDDRQFGARPVGRAQEHVAGHGADDAKDLGVVEAVRQALGFGLDHRRRVELDSQPRPEGAQHGLGRHIAPYRSAPLFAGRFDITDDAQMHQDGGGASRAQRSGRAAQIPQATMRQAAGRVEIEREHAQHEPSGIVEYAMMDRIGVHQRKRLAGDMAQGHR
ncbi:MAG: hypothetical protein WDM86_01480 [Rhizomicrobium sp.]